jgi:ATP-binding cassette subfamily F protein 3
MLRVQDLTLARGARRLLDGAELSLHLGHMVGLVGPYGAG